MKNNIKTYIFLFFTCFLILAFNTKPVFAAENAPADLKKVDVNLNKEWTIHFDSPISKDCINNNCFTVVDNNNKLVDAKVFAGNDEKSITIKPPSGGYYTAGVYYLKIKNVYSTDSKKLAKEFTMKFYISNVSNDEKVLQFQPPKIGDEIALVTTNKGVFKIRFFDTLAPKAIENFKTHAKQGYYNGLTFHRVISEFMIQSGDPSGNGTGGASIWGTPFEDEFTPTLHNFRGALSMANSGSNTNGSQFFIVQKSTIAQNTTSDSDLVAALEKADKKYYPQDIIDKYKQVGGTPWLDYKHTVFGQIFEGMDIVDDIANAKTNSSDKPVEDVIINKIEIITYSK